MAHFFSSRAWSHFMHGMLLCVIGLGISLQEDLDGGYLVDGWAGLNMCGLACLGLAVWNIFCLMRITVYGEELLYGEL